MTLIIPFIINLIKQVHYSGYISRIITSGHHPSIHNVKDLYITLQRNFIVFKLMPSSKIAFIILSFIDHNQDIKLVSYHDDEDYHDDDDVHNDYTSALEIKTNI